MRIAILSATLACAALVAVQPDARAHGGTYRGPQDTVPPGSGGGGGGGGAAPSTPTGPAGPSSGHPGAPNTPTPGGPSAPSNPARPSTGDSSNGIDLTAWQYWWAYNKAAYLRLKSHLYGSDPTTGDDTSWFGGDAPGQARDTLRPSDAQIRDRVVPPLLAVLERESSNDILTGAMIALAKIGEARDESGHAPIAEAIRRHLASSEQEVAETAVLALGILESEDETGLLADLLRADLPKSGGARMQSTHGLAVSGSVPDRTRAFAAFGLGLIGSSAQEARRIEIVNLLAGVLSGAPFAQRDVPVACLIGMGLAPLSIDTGDTAVSCARPGRITSRNQEIRWLLAYLSDRRNVDLIRAHVPTALARLVCDAPDAFPLRAAVSEALLATLERDPRESNVVQQSSVLALGQIGDCDADPLDTRIRTTLLALQKESKDQQARHFALIALAQIGGRPGRDKALTGLAEIRRHFAVQLSSGRNTARPWAGLAIGVLEHALAEANIVRSDDLAALLANALLDARSPDEVGAYAIGAGLAGDLGAAPILLSKLESTNDYEARGHVAVALGLLNERAAIDPIRAVVQASRFKSELLREAATALGLLGDKGVVPDLIAMLQGATSLSSQASVASALGFIGDARSIEPLGSLLRDSGKTDSARGFAAAALGIAADREDLPWNTRITLNINYRANTETLTTHRAGTGILDIL